MFDSPIILHLWMNDSYYESLFLISQVLWLTCTQLILENDGEVRYTGITITIIRHKIQSKRQLM